MSDAEAMMEGARPRSAREAALADIAERRRKDPNWDSRTDPAYRGPHPTFVALMSDAEYDRHMARREEERRRVLAHARSVGPQAVERECSPPVTRPVLRAALPFGLRIRDLRRTLGWTQRDIAGQLGVSTRTIVRYEQGRSEPLQSAPLLALRRLESAHAHLVTK